LRLLRVLNIMQYPVTFIYQHVAIFKVLLSRATLEQTSSHTVKHNGGSLNGYNLGLYKEV